MRVLGAPERNITLVAFYGDKKPEQLLQLITQLHRHIDHVVRDHDLSGAFNPCNSPQIHATLLGMEAVRVGGQLYNANFLNNNGHLRPIYPLRLLELLAAVAQSRVPLLRVRFGGFRRSHCTCRGFDLYDWKCGSSDSEFHAFNRSAYEGSFYAFSPGPAMLTGWPVGAASLNYFTRELYGLRRSAEGCGFLEKYHSAEKPYWKDDDFYLRLGTFGHCPSGKLESVVEQVRTFLSSLDPIAVDISTQDVSFVYYNKPSLQAISTAVPLEDAVNKPQLLEALYEQWTRDNA